MIPDLLELLVDLALLVEWDLQEVLELLGYLEQLDQLVMQGFVELQGLLVRQAVRVRWDLLVLQDLPDQLDLLEHLGLQDLGEEQDSQVLLVLVGWLVLLDQRVKKG